MKVTRKALKGGDESFCFVGFPVTSLPKYSPTAQRQDIQARKRWTSCCRDRDKDGNMPEFWTELFKGLEMDVPEGEPGTNPNDMSKDAALKPVHRYFNQHQCPF